MRFVKRRILGNEIEYECDVFVDSKNDVLIVNKVSGNYGLKDEKDICRELIASSLKEIKQSPYYSVDTYDNKAVNNEIDETISYLQDKINKLITIREVNNIINKSYEDSY